MKWKSRAPAKKCAAFQDQSLNPEHTPMGGSQWKQQETEHFPDTQYTDMIGEHFLSPWLQETGQGCLFFKISVWVWVSVGRNKSRMNTNKLKSTVCYGYFCSFTLKAAAEQRVSLRLLQRLDLKMQRQWLPWKVGCYLIEPVFRRWMNDTRSQKVARFHASSHLSV